MLSVGCPLLLKFYSHLVVFESETAYFHHQRPNPQRHRCYTPLYTSTSSASRLLNMNTSSLILLQDGALYVHELMEQLLCPVSCLSLQQGSTLVQKPNWMKIRTTESLAGFSGKIFVQLQWQISEARFLYNYSGRFQKFVEHMIYKNKIFYQAMDINNQSSKEIFMGDIQRNIHGRYTGIHKNVDRMALPFCHRAIITFWSAISSSNSQHH